LRANGSRECAPDDRLREAIHRAAQRKNGLLRCARNDVDPHASAFSRRDTPELCKKPSAPNKGRGECRAHGAPAVSCARVEGRTHTSRHGRTGITRHSRTQWAYGLYRALPGDRALLPPSPALLGANLTPASGRQDHTVLPYATRLRLSLRRAWYPSAETPAKAETAPFVAHAVSLKANTSRA
jgi:hypothetical protein